MLFVLICDNLQHHLCIDTATVLQLSRFAVEQAICLFFVVSGNRNFKTSCDNLKVAESVCAVIDHVLALVLLVTLPLHTPNELPWILKH